MNDYDRYILSFVIVYTHKKKRTLAFQDISMNDYLFIGQDEEVDKKKQV